MSGPGTGRSPLTRRRFLAATATAATGVTGGCVTQVRNIANRDTRSSVSVEIKTPPADSDRVATLIARHLLTNLRAVGIEARLVPLSQVELYRSVLFDDEFDLFVSKLPPVDDPDKLRTLCHSLFAEETGWQNPYSFTELHVDEQLTAQRTATGNGRQEAVADLLDSFTGEQPLTTVAYPDAIRATRSDRFTGWQSYSPPSPLTYFALKQADQLDTSGEVTLRLATTDPRITKNLNPLAVEYRGTETFIRLLYDPLLYRDSGESIPWLGAEIEWNHRGQTTARVTLRENLSWHDGTPLTTADVAFTYRFLEDTSLGEIDTTVPAPIYRGRSSLVRNVSPADDRTVEISFGDTTAEVAKRALTVPVLPAHIWEAHTGNASVSGVETANLTDALVWSNGSPVGSGPLRFEKRTPGESLTLRRFEEHFLNQKTPEPLTSRFGQGLAFDRLELRTAPSDAPAIEAIAAGNRDGTTATLTHHAVPLIGKESAVSLSVGRSNMPYHVGYNTSTEPFSNPYFRRLVARLIDKRHVVTELMNGYGTPAAHPFEETEWSPADSNFSETDPAVPFLGDDGDVDVLAAREAFRNRGFDFDESGSLVVK